MNARLSGTCKARMPYRNDASGVHIVRSSDPIRARPVFAVGIVLLLVAGHATAARWQLAPAANLQIGYDDNPQSQSTGAEGSFLTTLNASLRALRSTEASVLGLGVGVTHNRYLDAADLDNTGGYANLDLGYRLERHRFGLGLGFMTQSTLYAQGPESRLSQVNRRQQTLTLSPSWGFQMSERNSLDLAINLQDITFDDDGSDFGPEGGRLASTRDYRTGRVDLGVNHRLTERLSLTGTLGYDRYESRDITNEYDSYRLLAGANYQLSEVSYIAAQAGVRYTEQTVEDPFTGRTLTEDSSGPSFSLSYARSFERGGGFNLVALRELTPTGEGDVTDTTGLTANLSLQPGTHWRFGVTANAYRSRSPSGETARGDETSYSIGPSLSYRIAEFWGLSLGYLYTYRDFGDRGRDLVGGGEDAVSNAVFLNLSWTPRPWDL